MTTASLIYFCAPRRCRAKAAPPLWKCIFLTFQLSLSFACWGQWQYPHTKEVDASDTYFGKTYRDPYRWLEHLNNSEVETWFKAQAELTDRLLGKIPARDALAEEWMALDKLNPAAYSSITCEKGRVFYKKTLGGENVGKLFFRQGWNGPERLLFDPGLYRAGVVTTIESIAPSWDGRYVVLGLSSGGGGCSELRVLDVDRMALLPERMYPSFGPSGWTKGGKAFLYDAGKVTDVKSREIELNRKTMLHKVGSEFAADRDIFSNESYPELGLEPQEMPIASTDESHPAYVLGLAAIAQQEMRMFYAPASGLKRGKMQWKPLCARSDKLRPGPQLDGDYVYAVTYAGAPKYKVVRTRLKQPDWSHAETVIPEAEDCIQYIAKSRHYLFVVYSNGVVCRIVKYELATGTTAEVRLPASGTLDISCPDWRTDRCLVYIRSWTSPVTIYDFDARKDTFVKSVFNTDVSYPGFEDLACEEVEVRSHDGAMVPLSIIYRKGIPMDGSNSCILEGYGAYGMSLTPLFSVTHSVAKRGVVLAFAHTRGGGEKGEAWYKAGYKSTKPNTWKDFISCAEYLVSKGYTRPQKLAGCGTSAGGILISRAVTERPDLFRAIVCNVGCANALRMEFSPNGPVNTPEFGTVKDPVECQALAEMDGVQHVKKGVSYPAVLGVGGWNDLAVAPWQPGKFVAALQAATASSNPVLLKVNYDSGHSTEEKLVTFKDSASQFAFLLWQTGHKDFQPVENEP